MSRVSPALRAPAGRVSCMMSHTEESQVFMPRGVYGGSAPQCFSVTESHSQQPEPDTDEAEAEPHHLVICACAFPLMMCEKIILV